VPITGKIPRPSTIQRCVLAAALLLASVAAWSVAPTSAAPNDYRIDLKVLLLDDDSPWVDAIESQMKIEGVPFTRIDYDTHAAITAGSLSSGDRAFYQAVVVPDAGLGLLTGAERTALRSFEAKFGVREVDAYNYPSATFGLVAPPTFAGDLTGTTATVTAAGKAAGFGYLNGPVKFSIGSTGYLAQILPASSMPAGASFTTLVDGAAGGATGPLLGVYSSGGVEQLIITAAFNEVFPQFKTLAHGIISWMTRGVHFGYNRNNLTMHVDDAFAADAIWNSDENCTPSEDCPLTSTAPTVSVRMTPADVTYAAAWEAANNYTLTLPFNGMEADNTPPADPLTVAFVNNRNAFRWLNHGFQHIFQGCVQNFAVFPWACTEDPAVVPQTVPPTPLWVSQAAIYDEIQQNRQVATSLGLIPCTPAITTGCINAAEYLSGEHSGMLLLPQQPLDNPNFAAALTQAGITVIGSDASRDPGSRTIGSATTIPRHPTALYYNTATQAQAVDEYNWIYTTVAAGGSGICGTTVPPCLAAPLPLVGGFATIVATDAAFNMNFILGNDPRPFYAHVTNMTGDRLLYPWLDAILGTYKAAFTPATPLMNLSLTQAATALDRQTKWAATGAPAVTGYVQSGNLSITNPIAGQMVPITAPAGTTISGATLDAYGGEVSGWLTAGNKTGTVPAAVYATTGNPAFTVGVAGAVGATATATPTASMFVTGTVPAGLTLVATPTSLSVTGTPAAGTAGSYPLAVRVVSAAGTKTQTITVVVSNPAPPTTTTTTPPPTTTTPPPPGPGQPAPGTDHVALTPARLADTRTGATTVDGLFAGTGIQQRGTTMELQVSGRGGVSADAAAAVLNVTVADATGGGFVTVYPCGEAQPTASNLNFVAGSIVPNAVVAKIGAAGKVCLFVSNDTQLVVDVNGYFPATTTLHSINPARVLDTRTGYTTIDGLQQGGGMSAGGTSTAVQIDNRATVPADATAVVLNVTVTEAQQPGFVAVYPCGTAVPTASNINYLTGSTVANLVVSKIGADGNVCIFSNSTTHLVVDVDGYFPALTSYSALDPARLLDTRPGFSTIDGQFVGADIRPAGTITELTVTNRGGVPANATTVVLNVTSTDATQSGFLTVYPCGVETPLASNLNYIANTTAAVAVFAKVGADGKVCILNSGATQIVADVNGYIIN
jgi:hypothetical protein